MPRFPQRKTLYALVILGGLAAGGCASRTEPKAISPSTPAKIEAAATGPTAPLTRSMPAPPPVLKPTTPRTLEFTPPPERTPEGWTYRKPASDRPTLGLFEEAVLLGQIRGALKQFPAGSEVKTTKVKNRTALLIVSPRVDNALAREIGARLLELKSLEEVRLTPGS